MQINSFFRPGCLAAPSPTTKQTGGRKEGGGKKGKEKRKKNKEGKKPSSHLQQKQLGGPEGTRKRQPPKVQECSTPTCPEKGYPGGRATRSRAGGSRRLQRGKRGGRHTLRRPHRPAPPVQTPNRRPRAQLSRTASGSAFSRPSVFISGRAQPGSGGGGGGGGEGGRGRHEAPCDRPTYPENDIEAEDEIFDATTDFRPLVVLPGHPLRS